MHGFAIGLNNWSIKSFHSSSKKRDLNKRPEAPINGFYICIQKERSTFLTRENTRYPRKAKDNNPIPVEKPKNQFLSENRQIQNTCKEPIHT